MYFLIFAAFYSFFGVVGFESCPEYDSARVEFFNAAVNAYHPVLARVKKVSQSVGVDSLLTNWVSISETYTDPFPERARNYVTHLGMTGRCADADFELLTILKDCKENLRSHVCCGALKTTKIRAFSAMMGDSSSIRWVHDSGRVVDQYLLSDSVFYSRFQSLWDHSLLLGSVPGKLIEFIPQLVSQNDTLQYMIDLVGTNLFQKGFIPRSCSHLFACQFIQDFYDSLVVPFRVCRTDQELDSLRKISVRQ